MEDRYEVWKKGKKYVRKVRSMKERMSGVWKSEKYRTIERKIWRKYDEDMIERVIGSKS